MPERESIREAPDAIHFEDLSHSLFEGSPQPLVAVSSPSHTVRYVNPAFTRLIGKRATELVGLPFNEAVPEKECNQCMDLLRRVYRTGVGETLIEQEHGDHHTSYWSYFAWAILSPDERPIGVMLQVTDVTETATFRQDVTSMNQALLVSATRQHEMAEVAESSAAHLRELNQLLEQRAAENEHQARQLRELNLTLARLEQRERKHLAEVLHDGMQQVLVAAKLQLETLRHRVDASGRESVDRVHELLGQCITASRSLAVELFPPALHYGGLVPGLNWLAEQMRQRQNLTVDVLAGDDVEPATDELRMFLFQATRELLFNVVKHAGVQRATVKLQRDFPPGGGAGGSVLRLEVSDSGKGFDAGVPGPKVNAVGHASPLTSGAEELVDGFGMASVRNRVESQGGVLTTETAPGQGTRVTLNVPDTPPTANQPGPRSTYAIL